MEYVCNGDQIYDLLVLLIKLRVIKGIYTPGVVNLMFKNAHHTYYFLPPEDQL